MAGSSYDETWEPGLPLPPEESENKPHHRWPAVVMLALYLVIVGGLGWAYHEREQRESVEAEAIELPAIDAQVIESIPSPESFGRTTWDQAQDEIIGTLLNAAMQMEKRLTDLERRQLTLENYHLGHTDKEFPIEPRVNPELEFHPPRSTPHRPFLPDLLPGTP